MWQLLNTFSRQELRAHPWRSATAVLAVMLGVALAFSVHLINASALSEFSSAVRSANGEPDLELRAVLGGFDEALYGQVANHPLVQVASPVLEIQTLGLDRLDSRKPLRIVGIDALVVAGISPALLPVPDGSSDRLAVFAADTVFLNPAAQLLAPALPRDGAAGSTLKVQRGMALHPVKIAGTVSAGGSPLAVMDIGAAQEMFSRQGQLSRIDVRLRAGVDKTAFVRSLRLPADVAVAMPDDDTQRVGNLSRAYRVNLTVLALVALFTGAFLVFSVLALSVARRSAQFALLGVLGLSARQRLQLVLAEAFVIGLAGSVAGVAVGTALAALALRVLAGDLGGGYFPGVAPGLEWRATAAAAYAALGTVAALAGGFWPARAVRNLPLAQTLKGLGMPAGTVFPLWISALLILAAAALASLPPLFGIPLAAYLSIGLLLVGGIAGMPWLVGLLYERVAPCVASRLLPLLAVERARRVRETAAVAVSGVVAALSLAVALTVMVASFRESVTRWLDVVLPADLYVRTSIGSGAGDTAYLAPGLVQDAAAVEGVLRIRTQRVAQLQLDPRRPAVALIARAIDDPARDLPLTGEPLPVPPPHVGVYVSEAMVDLYGARPGALLPPLSALIRPAQQARYGDTATFFVAGVWRDYVRQGGAIVIAQRDYRRLTGDPRVNDMAITLAPGADAGRVQQAIRDIARRGDGEALIDFASAREIRAVSLRIFDRSFAVTYWLQAVAIAIGLFGVAASFSAQVLSRRKEFGLLAHLGLTRYQILAVVAGEGLAWTLLGALVGLALGLAVALILVHVINPQSFHWTMELLLPWTRLVLLCGSIVLAGTATAWVAGRSAAGRDAVLAVREDW